MAIYDLSLKIRGLAAFCGHRIDNYTLGDILLYTDTVSEAEVARQVSRLFAGQKPLSNEQRASLTGEFNKLIAKVARVNDPDEARGPIRPGDWDLSAPEFFRNLAKLYERNEEKRLDDAHAAMIGLLNGMARYRAIEPSLVVHRAPRVRAAASRIPASAIRADPLDLPPITLNAGRPMTISLLSAVARESRGWLFYVRDTDTHTANAVSDWLWSESTLENLLFWSPSPFRLPEGFSGELPGFPENARNLTGEVTCHLIVEPAESPAVAKLLTEVAELDEGRPPSFEATVHMITQSQKLFQVGNRSKEINYPPPILYTRRYIVREMAC